MATAIWSAPVLPGEASFGGPIMHSRDYRNPQPFRALRVLVVGSGNSGPRSRSTWQRMASKRRRGT